jgi:hypothetical protein
VVGQEETFDGKDFNQMVMPRLMASVTSVFDSIFFTDGLKGVYQSGGPESSFRLKEPSEVFTSEMSAIFVALIQIR